MKRNFGKYPRTSEPDVNDEDKIKNKQARRVKETDLYEIKLFVSELLLTACVMNSHSTHLHRQLFRVGGHWIRVVIT